jgi:hypothetical protein
MGDNKHMLSILKANPSWIQQAIVDEFNKTFCKEVKRNTMCQVLNSSNKILGIQSEAAKYVHRFKDPKYPQRPMP